MYYTGVILNKIRNEILPGGKICGYIFAKKYTRMWLALLLLQQNSTESNVELHAWAFVLQLGVCLFKVRVLVSIHSTNSVSMETQYLPIVRKPTL